MARRTTGTDGRLRCGSCRGFVSPGRRCAFCANQRATEKADADRAAKSQCERARRDLDIRQAALYRRRKLGAYVDMVLGLGHGAERLAAMESTSVSEFIR